MFISVYLLGYLLFSMWISCSAFGPSPPIPLNILTKSSGFILPSLPSAETVRKREKIRKNAINVDIISKIASELLLTQNKKEKKSFDSESFGNPEEPVFSDLYQGDIKFPENKKPFQTNLGFVSGNQKAFNPVKYSIQKWADGKVPYKIDQSAEKYLSEIQLAVDDFNSRTCVKWIHISDRDEDDSYVIFQAVESGCWSYVGRIGGRQEINIGSGCTGHGTILHEMIHTIGFWHEQARYDRNDYIKIKWANIAKGRIRQFDIVSQSESNLLDVPYNYLSIMHYSSHAFSSNGEPTIVAADPSIQSILGQRNGFSTLDITKINKLYKCSTALNPDTESDCSDKKKSTICKYWSSHGFCDMDSPFFRYARMECPLSCGLCKKNVVCKDNSEHCDFWRFSGYCWRFSQYFDYMQQNCLASCNLCIV